MKQLIVSLSLAIVMAAPALSLQQHGSAPISGAKPQSRSVPTVSPEPVTMMALAGGAAAAGGFALSRKRKNKRG